MRGPVTTTHMLHKHRIPRHSNEVRPMGPAVAEDLSEERSYRLYMGNLARAGRQQPNP